MYCKCTYTGSTFYIPSPFEWQFILTSTPRPPPLPPPLPPRPFLIFFPLTGAPKAKRRVHFTDAGDPAETRANQVSSHQDAAAIPSTLPTGIPPGTRWVSISSLDQRYTAAAPQPTPIRRAFGKDEWLAAMGADSTYVKSVQEEIDLEICRREPGTIDGFEALWWIHHQVGGLWCRVGVGKPRRETRHAYSYYMQLLCTPNTLLVYIIKNMKCTPAMRSKISSKLMFRRCVRYSDRAITGYVSSLRIRIGRRLRVDLACTRVYI